VGGGTENLNAGHLVPFYGHEEELPGRVAGYPHREAAGRWPEHAAARTFAFSGEAPAAARHFAVEALRRLGAGELADDAALVVTELAANAVIHARSAFTVDLAIRPDGLRTPPRSP